MSKTHPHFCWTPRHVLFTTTASYYRCYQRSAHTRSWLCLCTNAGRARRQRFMYVFKSFPLFYSNTSHISDKYIPNLKISFHYCQYFQRVQRIILTRYMWYGTKIWVSEAWNRTQTSQDYAISFLISKNSQCSKIMKIKCSQFLKWFLENVDIAYF